MGGRSGRIWVPWTGEGTEGEPRRYEDNGNEKDQDVPFKDNMIHIKNAVKVKASGKIKRSTIHSGAFCHQL